MATQSFLTDFKFTTKSGAKIINAFENSKTSEHVIPQKVEVVRNSEKINNLMDAFLGARR
ncbi:hypothetical protein [Rummeliibacillus stabekisii]|uniref:Uncharacterized protein n=1 Tax=Rummeliibacillus stabekisii TaxID=241244 RepID=A0A143HAF2_9BACL|nr:hypothetical protein [Rummeliibacillus stabekisii]AMW98465.1 hypothetical protein ATY39_02850 [Rummeliibacillus stabekisii]